MSKHDETITISMPVWAFQGIMNGLEKWMGRGWDDDVEITAPITFDVVPPSWQIEVEEGQRYLTLKTSPADGSGHHDQREDNGE